VIDYPETHQKNVMDENRWQQSMKNLAQIFIHLGTGTYRRYKEKALCFVGSWQLVSGGLNVL